MLRSEEPDAGNPHVRICGSPGLATARGHPTVFALKLRNQRSGLKIDSETTIPLWEGERMDDGMAVEGLLQLE